MHRAGQDSYMFVCTYVLGVLCADKEGVELYHPSQRTIGVYIYMQRWTLYVFM